MLRHVLDGLGYGAGAEVREHALNVLVRDRGGRIAAFALVLIGEVGFVEHRLCEAVRATVPTQMSSWVDTP